MSNFKASMMNNKTDRNIHSMGHEHKSNVPYESAPHVRRWPVGFEKKLKWSKSISNFHTISLWIETAGRPLGDRW